MPKIIIKAGQKATCQRCKRGILWVRGLQGLAAESEDVPEWAKDRTSAFARRQEEGWVLKDGYYQDHWEHADDHTTQCERFNILPREFCTHRKTNYEMCLRPVPQENKMADVFACGIHERAAVEEMQRAEKAREADERRKLDDQLRNWQAEEQLKAIERLKELGFGEAITTDHAIDTRWGNEGKHFRQDRCTFDPSALLAIIEGHWEQVSGEEEEDNEDDEAEDVFG